METSPFHVTAARLHHVEQTITLHVRGFIKACWQPCVCVCVTCRSWSPPRCPYSDTVLCWRHTPECCQRASKNKAWQRERGAVWCMFMFTFIYDVRMMNVNSQQEGDTADNHTAGLCAASRGRFLYTQWTQFHSPAKSLTMIKCVFLSVVWNKKLEDNYHLQSTKM